MVHCSDARIYQIVSLGSGPNGIRFESIDPKDRVAVSEIDSTGGVTVAFLASILDESGQTRRGLYTVRVTGLDTGLIQVGKVFPVLREGDSFTTSGTNTDVVATIGVNDPLNNNGQLGFWVASANGGQFILQASPTNIVVNELQLGGSSSSPSTGGQDLQDQLTGLPPLAPMTVNLQIDRLVPSHGTRINVFASASTTLKTAAKTLLGYIKLMPDRLEAYGSTGILVDTAMKTAQLGSYVQTILFPPIPRTIQVAPMSLTKILLPLSRVFRPTTIPHKATMGMMSRLAVS